MAKKSIDWDDMRVFLSLARCRSLSSAAREIGLTHSTISRRISSFEDSLGRPLFERRPEGFSLTQQGTELMAFANLIEESFHSVHRWAENTPVAKGTVRVTATEALSNHFLIPRLTELHRLAPGVDIEFIISGNSLSLARREGDIAIRLARPRADDLVTRRLGEINYGVFRGRNYLPEADPNVTCYVGYTDDMSEIPEARWFADWAAGRRFAFRSNSLVAQLSAARAGFGLALLPYFLAADDPALVPVHEQTGLTREIWLAVPNEIKNSPRIRAVIDAIVTIFQTERALLRGPANS